VTCLIFRELGEYLKQNPQIEEFYLLAQHPPVSEARDYSRVASVLKCVDRNVINIVDTAAPLLEYRRKNPENYLKLFSGFHMNRWGNRLIGELLGAAMAEESAAGE
jgi:hypothetical protein